MRLLAVEWRKCSEWVVVFVEGVHSKGAVVFVWKGVERFVLMVDPGSEEVGVSCRDEGGEVVWSCVCWVGECGD